MNYFFIILQHLFYPWQYSNFDIAMNNFALSALILLAIPGLSCAFFSIGFLSERESNNVSLYLNVCFICYLFFIFYWYLALMLSIGICLFMKWANEVLQKYYDEEEADANSSIKRSRIKRPLKIMTTPNLKLIFILCAILPIVMIIALEIFGLKYRFF